MPAEKTLFLSHINPGTPNDIGNGYLREFTKNGVLFLDYNDIYLEHGHRGAQEFIKRHIADNGIGTLIFGEDPTTFYFPPEFFSGLRDRVFTVMMAGDTVYYFDVRDKYYAGAMDLFVIYDSFDTARAFEKLGGEALVFLSSYDRTRYHKIAGCEKSIDISFVGALAGRKDREDYLAYLAANGVDVKVFGYGSPGGQVSLEQMVEIFNKSRINLSFTDTSAPSRLTRGRPLPAGARQLKGRAAEVALCGSFVLSENAQDLDRMFLPGEELAVFSTKEELLEKIRFYLKNDKEREAVAARGYRRAAADYDAALAIPRLLAEIESRRTSGKRSHAALPPDKEFTRNFASFRMLCIIKFLKRLSFSFALEEAALAFKSGSVDLRQLYTFFVEEVVDKFPRAKAFFKKLLFRWNS